MNGDRPAGFSRGGLRPAQEESDKPGRGLSHCHGVIGTSVTGGRGRRVLGTVLTDPILG